MGWTVDQPGECVIDPRRQQMSKRSQTTPSNERCGRPVRDRPRVVRRRRERRWVLSLHVSHGSIPPSSAVPHRHITFRLVRAGYCHTFTDMHSFCLLHYPRVCVLQNYNGGNVSVFGDGEAAWNEECTWKVIRAKRSCGAVPGTEVEMPSSGFAECGTRRRCAQLPRWKYVAQSCLAQREEEVGEGGRRANESGGCGTISPNELPGE